jgi:transcriptional regulator with XRE-family HTH domain
MVRIMELKNIRAITWHELATQSGISPARMDYWINSGIYQASRDELLKLAGALHVPPDEIRKDF